MVELCAQVGTEVPGLGKGTPFGALRNVRRHLRHRLVSVRLLGTTLSTLKTLGIHATEFLDIRGTSEWTVLLAELR
jgi:hypothetical protein